MTTRRQEAKILFDFLCSSNDPNADDEIERVLKSDFGAVEIGRVAGPYSWFLEMIVRDIQIVIHFDDWITVMAENPEHNGAVAMLIDSLVEILNSKQRFAADASSGST